MSEKETPKPFDFKTAFAKAVEDTQRVWSHDRSLTLGASEAFRCLRWNYYLKFHPELADKSRMSMGFATRGNVMENHYVVPMLKRIFGEDRVLFASEEQESFVLQRNSATPDSLIFPETRDVLKKYGIDDIQSDCFATEIKSFDPMMVLDEEKAFHRGQGIMQLGLFRELTEHKPEFVVVLYVNASDYLDIRPFVVQFDPIVFAAGRARAKRVYEAKEAYALEAEGMHNGQCENCPFIRACRGEEVARAVTEVHELEMDAWAIFDKMALDYLKYQKLEKEAKEEKSRAGEQIKRLLAAYGTKGVSTDDYSMSNARIAGKSSYDMERMEDDGIDIDKYLVQGNPYTRLSVRKKTAKKKSRDADTE